MVTRFSVHDIEHDEGTLSRKTTVKIGTSGDVKFETPLRAGSKGVTEVPFYEIHKRVSPEKIRGCLESQTKDSRFGVELKKMCRGSFNVLVIEYDSNEIVPPSRMIDGLSDIQYNNTDAIVIPSWFDLITKKEKVDVDRYLDLSGNFLDAASTRNHKPIFATIPQSIPPESLDRVIDFFIDRDVTSFIVDSHGRSIMSGSWVRAFQRNLTGYGIEKECVLFTMNTYQGVMRKDVTRSEAKDFIGFTAGFDIIGGKYVGKYHGNFDKEVKKEDFGRVFDRDTYTYLKRTCSKEEKQIINEQTVRSQNKEFENVKAAIKESAVKPLLETKELSKETLDIIMSFNDRSRSTKLDEFI